MAIRTSEFKFISARKLRAISSGVFKKIKSTKREIKLSKMELKRRGLKLKLTKR